MNLRIVDRWAKWLWLAASLAWAIWLITLARARLGQDLGDPINLAVLLLFVVAPPVVVLLVYRFLRWLTRPAD